MHNAVVPYSVDLSAVRLISLYSGYLLALQILQRFCRDQLHVSQAWYRCIYVGAQGALAFVYSGDRTSCHYYMYTGKEPGFSKDFP